MITNTPSGEEKTELLYGVEATVEKAKWFMKNVKIGMDLFGEKNGPSIIIEFEVYKNNYIDIIKKRMQNTFYYGNNKRESTLLQRIRNDRYRNASFGRTNWWNSCK